MEAKVIKTADSKFWNQIANEGIDKENEYTYVVVCEIPEDEDSDSPDGREALESKCRNLIFAAKREAGLESSSDDTVYVENCYALIDCWKPEDLQ